MGLNRADLSKIDHMSNEEFLNFLDRTMAEGKTIGQLEKGGAKGTRNAFVGEVGAESLGIGRRGEAEQMEKNGASREDIWRKTGWWRGKDGKWRVEEPDISVPRWKIEWLENQSRLYGKEVSLATLAAAPELFKAYPDLGARARVSSATPGFFAIARDG